MKVLTIKEPFATLIKNKIKYIETRSWKTKYRGELYIQASASKLAKEIKDRKELMNLFNDKDLSYGNIICKCNLVDCIYMTDKFIEEEKNKNYNNFISGNYKVGRYAWVLDNITIIKPIPVKGKLGIWNYDEKER